MALLNLLNSTPIPADSAATEETINIVEIVKQFKEQDLSEVIRYIGGEALHLLGNIFVSIVVYYIGRWIIRRIVKIIDHTFEQREVEISVRSFIRSIVKVLCYLIIIIVVVQILGINTTSLVAMLASAGLAVGMALSGTLQNFAGGVMILFLKPYRVGDYITSQGESGIVKEIMLFTTVLETYDRHTIFVPNSSISSAVIDNATFAETRRVDWKVSVSYGTPVAKCREVILEVLSQDPRIINSKERPSVVVLNEMGDSSVNLIARGWCRTDHYWDVLFDNNERIYTALPEQGIGFPFPQLDVHIKQ